MKSRWLILFLLFGVSILSAQPGAGPLIEQRLSDLRENPVTLPLPGIPNDESALPADWLALVSWNVQVGGVSTSPDALRPPLVADALSRLFLQSYQLLAAQEISGAGNAGMLTSMLPGSADSWSASFLDSTDTQDNGFWLRSPVEIRDERTLFITSMTDASGRFLTDPARAVHPPRAAHFTIGDFDFTLITVHLTFASGDTSESARELGVLLEYLEDYFEKPEHDPDVIICGDFNIPSRLSGQTGSDGIILDPIFDDDPRFQEGERRFVVTVHDPTSRRSAANGGTPNNNFDHFIFSADTLEELVQARRVSTEILTDHPDDPEQRLTSDHFPIVAFFRTTGNGIELDLGQPKLSISSVVNGGSFELGIASGAWVTIFGSDLAPATRTWRADEIVDGVLPTELDGVRVLINDKPAAVFFISPGQLSVQAPDDMSVGPVAVEVIRDGVGSVTENADLRQAAPGFFLFNQEGRKFIAAVHTDGVFVGRPDLFGGALAARPAMPGDVILLFGTGFGRTEPPVPAGRVFNGAAALEDQVKILFGGIEAEVLFAGVSGAGLNQFNVVVPTLVQGGDIAVTAETLGEQTQAGAFLTIEGVLPPPPAPTVTLTVTPATIQEGQSATLQWNSTDAQRVEISPDIGVVSLSGSRTVSPTMTTTYTITATGAGGTARRSITLTVIPLAAPTVSISASPETIQAGQSTTLQWMSSNATAVSINQGIGSVAPNGSTMVSPTQTTTYTITAQGPGGTRSASATVTVTQSNFGPCGSKTTCGQMTSCAEAMHFLNVCKVTRLDGDSDGVPCESICPGG